MKALHLIFTIAYFIMWTEGAPEDGCKENEIKDECLGEKTCKNFYWNKRDHCPVPCTLGCVCDQGFVRRGKKCIPYEKCPEGEKFKLKCKENEEQDDSGTRCDGSCFNRVPICAPNCGPPKCFCLPGFVRNNDKCILESHCPL